MKKFSGMLFCTDLDGTLYSSDKTVSKQNLDAIEYFKSEGGLFTFITGRVPMTSEEICEIIHPNAPFGCLNGGGIYDKQREEYLWKLCLSEDMIELVREVDRQLPDVGIQLNTERTIYFNKDNPAMVRFRELTGLPNIGCHYEKVSEPVLKVVFGHLDGGRIDELIKLLAGHPRSDRFDFIRSESMLYEILPRGASKGAALCKMAELLGIVMDKTVAVGDYNNDISMIKAAKAGFAVDNAVDEVKAVADYIAPNNDDNAIAAIIDMLDRGAVKL